MTMFTFLLLVLAVGLLSCDWYQTIQIARHPYKWFEINKILGKHPTEERVDIYFVLVIFLTIAAACWASYFGYETVTRLCLGVVAAIEAWVVRANYILGIS